MPKNLMIGYTFTARKTYPFVPVGTRTSSINDFADKDVTYVKTDERVKIIAFDKEKGLYKLLNISLDEDNAWFEVTEKELLKLQRKAPYK